MIDINIDFTITATCRPQVLKQTLDSFSTRLVGVRMKQCTAWLNVDPIPDPGSAMGPAPMVWDVVHVAAKYFAIVNVNMPLQASFPAAVKWCWSKPTTNYFFHLEDDWTLDTVFSIEQAVKLLDLDPTLSCVNLRAYNFRFGDDRICLSPGLHRAAHARVMSERLTLDANPEKQLRPVAADNPHGNRHLGFHGIQVPDKPIISDIGRAWLASSGWQKNKPVHFTTWERA